MDGEMMLHLDEKYIKPIVDKLRDATGLEVYGELVDYHLLLHLAFIDNDNSKQCGYYLPVQYDDTDEESIEYEYKYPNINYDFEHNRRWFMKRITPYNWKVISPDSPSVLGLIEMVNRWKSA
jgi:hypothetical protein